MVSPTLKPADSLLPAVLLQVGPVSPPPRLSEVQRRHTGAWRRYADAEEEMKHPRRDHCAEGLRGVGRGF